MKKKKITTSTKVSFILVILFLATLVFSYFYKLSPKTIEKPRELFSYPGNLFYKVFNYPAYFSKIQNFYPPVIKIKIEKNIITGENTDIKNSNTQNTSNTEYSSMESVIITSSLTSTTGAISVSGKCSGVNIIYQGKQINTQDGNFSFVSGTNYNIDIKRKKTDLNIIVKSPSYSTNDILNQLSLQIDPISMTATIIGKVNLILPGKIKGSLFNVSNGSNSSTILKDGYFSTSVALKIGTNQLTASGQWYTISLDLPSLIVVVSEK